MEVGPDVVTLEVWLRASVRAPAVMVVGVEERLVAVVVARSFWRFVVIARSTAAKGRYLLASSGGGWTGPPFARSISISTSPLAWAGVLEGGVGYSHSALSTWLASTATWLAGLIARWALRKTSRLATALWSGRLDERRFQA